MWITAFIPGYQRPLWWKLSLGQWYTRFQLCYVLILRPWTSYLNLISFIYFTFKVEAKNVLHRIVVSVELDGYVQHLAQGAE
jgi:hypothetical protein